MYVGQSIQTHSGDKGIPMQITYNLNEPYSETPFDADNVFLGNFIHKLAHRLLMSNGVRTRPEKHGYLRTLVGHRRIYLFLYDVLVDVLGKEYAENEVKFEKQHLSKAYSDAWEWLLKKPYPLRQQSLHRLRTR